MLAKAPQSPADLTGRQGLTCLTLASSSARVEEQNPSDRAQVEIYRPFFLSGILTVLTAGCLLGAIALAGVAAKGSFTLPEWTPYIWAHANSQFFGWVGFFVMGFALQQHAPSVGKKQIFLLLAYASLIMMGVGIALRFVAEPLSRIDPQTWVPIGIFSCGLQTAAVFVFLYNSGANRHRSQASLTWPTLFVFGSLFWLTVVAISEPFLFAASHQVDSAASLAVVAKWFSPYREIQFLGFAAMMIFGVAGARLPRCFEFQSPHAKWGIAGFGFWMAALVLRVGSWLTAIDGGQLAAGSWLYQASSGLLVIGAACLVFSLRIFERPKRSLPSHRFIRAAFAWLMIAVVLAAAEPLHLYQAGLGFSHAYVGGIRHAVTVGFISQMILGVGMHVVSAMNDRSETDFPSMILPIVLLNAGNFGRVALEIATDYAPGAFLPMGVTGFVELTAIIIWACAMVSTMRFGARRVRNAA